MNVSRFNLKSLQPRAVLIYLFVIAAAFALAHSRVSSASSEAAKPAVPENVETVVSFKPVFSLATNRTFGTKENPRMWVDYRGIDKLELQVYGVDDPQRFFSQLSNPHQMAAHEHEEVTRARQRN